MTALLNAVFQAGQSIPCGIKVHPKSYIPSRTSLGNSLTSLASVMRHEFRKILVDTILPFGGAISVDVVTLKVQNRHFYEFTFHHIDVKKPKILKDTVELGTKVSTIMLIEGPKTPNAENIRQ